MAADRIFFATSTWKPTAWQDAFAKHASDRPLVLETDGEDDPSIRYAVAWHQPPGVLKNLPNLEVIFSSGAGVDHLLNDPGLPDVPIVRVVSENLTERMSEYVVWQVLDHHRQGVLYRSQQVAKSWIDHAQKMASDVTIGVMGLGVLGQDAAQKLSMLGFNVTGWSRTAKDVANVTTFAGESGLDAFLVSADMVVVLLPLTGATSGLLNRSLFHRMKQGAVLINAGRGGLQKDADILAALEDGQLSAASLDVFEEEPLPSDSPLWAHSAVTVTPHAAAASDPSALVPAMIRQMEAHERGEPLTNLVDKAAGY